MQIAAVALLAFAVRVAVTVEMTGGCTAAEVESERADGHDGAAATATAAVAGKGMLGAAKEAADRDPLEAASAAVLRRVGRPVAGEPVGATELQLH